MTRTRRVVAVLICGGAVAALLWALGHMRSPEQTLMWGQLMNFGHVPLFAVVASCVLGLCMGLLGNGLPQHRLYVVALVWSLALAGASEALQVLDDRNVEALDFLRNAVGAVGALALWASVDRRLEVDTAWPGWRKHLRSFAVVIVLAALVPVAMMAESYRRIDGRVPVLFHFDSVLELPFIRKYDAELELVRSPQGWTEYAGRRVGRVTFQRARYSTIAIFEMHRDWEAYEWLEWDLFLEGDLAIDVVLRIDDLKTNGRYKDRFNVKLPLRPGSNRLRIPLAEVRDGPESRAMNLGAINTLMLFVSRPEKPVFVYVADLKLVRAKEERR